MRRSVFVAAVLLLVTSFSASGAWAFGQKDVIQMSRDGIEESLIVQKIRHSGKVFHLDARDLRTLKQEGVSDTVVSAMLATEDQYDAYGPYYRPRGSYYYSPYYSYPRVTVGLGFYGYHGGGYYHGYGSRGGGFGSRYRGGVRYR